MILTQQEIDSALWQKFTVYLQNKLEALRQQNDGDVSLEATARLRGRIAQIKFILALGETQEPVQTDSDF